MQLKRKHIVDVNWNNDAGRGKLCSFELFK